MRITGAKQLVKALKFEGVDTVFAYPGGYITDVFDELYKQDDIKMILPRHEQALVHEADGYARTTGKVGVCIVTSGPGATNLVTGIANAYYDSVPLVCFTGQVPRKQIGNDAFQEVDIVGITRSITKHSIIVTDRDELPRIIKEAFYIANTGKPGPVLVDLPADMMKEIREEHYPKNVNIRSYKPNDSVHIGQLKRAVAELKKAERPVFLIGGGVRIAKASEELIKVAEKTKIPVITTIMGRGAIPTDHELFVGDSGMHGSYACNMAITECDVLFSIGARFSDRTTGDLDNFAPKAKIIHIDIDTASISRTVKVDIPIVADAKLALQKMLPMLDNYEHPEWIAQINEWKSTHPIRPDRHENFGPSAIMELLNDHYQEVIAVTDVGQHQMWTTQYLDMTKGRELVTSGGLGTMGYGFPAAIGAQLGNLDKKVLCISGDGGFQMNLQEMATAVAEELPITIIIMNNGYLGMVRQMQQLFYDKNYAHTCLRHRRSCSKYCGIAGKECPPYLPDFVKLAESYDAVGIRAFTKEDLKAALLKAESITDRPTLIECMIAPDEQVYPMVKTGAALSDMIMED